MSLSFVAKSRVATMGRASFAVGMIVIGCQHFFFRQFVPWSCRYGRDGFRDGHSGFSWWELSLSLAGERSSFESRRVWRRHCWQGYFFCRLCYCTYPRT